MSTDDKAQDSKVLANLMVLTGVLFGFFVAMIFLARTIVY